MPRRGVKSAKLKREYKHIKDSYKKRGKDEGTAEEIAARTVNKQKSKKKSTAKKKSSSSTKSTGSKATTKKRTSSKN